MGQWTRSSLQRIGITLALVVALFVPAVTGHDSFPLSTHPVYASARDRDETLTTVIGIEVDGRAVRLSLGTIASTDDPLIAQSYLRRAVERSALAETCSEISARVASASDFENVGTIAIVTEQVDLVDFVESGRIDDRTTLATCDVTR